MLTDILTLLCGLGLFGNASNDADRRSEGLALFLTILTVAVNALFIVYLLWTLCYHSHYLESAKNFLRKCGPAGDSTASPTPAIALQTMNSSVTRHLDPASGRMYSFDSSTGETSWVDDIGEFEAVLEGSSSQRNSAWGARSSRPRARSQMKV